MGKKTFKLKSKACIALFHTVRWGVILGALGIVVISIKGIHGAV